MSEKTLKNRQEIDPAYTWNLEDMIQDDETWENLFNKIKTQTDELHSFEGRLTESKETLLDGLKKHDQLMIDFTRIYVYSGMNLHQDTGNSLAQEKVQKLGSLEVLINEKLAFWEPEIMSTDTQVILDYLDASDELSAYRHYFENMLRQKSHILPKEQEALLALSGDFSESPQEIFSMFMNADLSLPQVTDEDGKKITLTLGNYQRLVKSQTRQVRKEAFEAIHSTMKAHKNTLNSIYSASLKKDLFMTKARKYETTLDASLDGKNIPTLVYSQLLDTVHEHLPLLHRYVRIRKEIMGLDELHMYDLYTPLVKDIDSAIPFDKAKEIVLEALAPMGQEYLSYLKKGFNEGWIDVYENKGKRSGAYSWSSYDVHPYVLMNYEDTLNNTFTLAHEMGHALHSYYSNGTQPFVYHSYPIFLAEVASTVNESLLIRHLLKKTTDKNERKYLINHFLESFRTTLYRQVMFAEFEKGAHEMMEKGEPVTSDSLSEYYHSLNHTYYGDDIVIDDLISYEWSRIPHFYTPYYVYQYATGFSSAVAISQMILDEGEDAVNRYKEGFLKSGCSKYPLETLQSAGVDMTSPEPIRQALSVFEELLDELETLIKE